MPPKFHAEDPKDLSRSTSGYLHPRMNGVIKQADAGERFRTVARPRRDWSAVLEWAEREAAAAAERISARDHSPNAGEASASSPPELPSEPTYRAGAWLRFAGVAVGLVAAAAAAVFV